MLLPLYVSQRFYRALCERPQHSIVNAWAAMGSAFAVQGMVEALE